MTLNLERFFEFKVICKRVGTKYCKWQMLKKGKHLHLILSVIAA